MKPDLDLFTEACIDTRSVPPWLDPLMVKRVSCDPWKDSDHVGENDIGRVGNDRMVWVVYVDGKDGSRLHAKVFPNEQESAAWHYMDELLAKIDRNRQQEMAV